MANGGRAQGSGAEMEGAKTKRGLLAASGQVHKKMPVSLVSAIQASDPRPALHPLITQLVTKVQ